MLGLFKSKKKEPSKEVKVTDPKLYAKILLSLKDIDRQYLQTYDWEIFDEGNHFYRIDGVHPILQRIVIPNYFFIKHY